MIKDMNQYDSESGFNFSLLFKSSLSLKKYKNCVGHGGTCL